ncbi:hypothetical protein FNV43_RR20985 [Rhamnella rubrinervis]|uniref:Uncharacterized protein n=1 Tax=Rhamnella rubrinervis TaxID=2594499 RepID=A0A8K0E1T0_9ROSA|nr:hypothetical protein FNV43_RR20985 [Rhamnella rubrinervis]
MGTWWHLRGYLGQVAHVQPSALGVGFDCWECSYAKSDIWEPYCAAKCVWHGQVGTRCTRGAPRGHRGPWAHVQPSKLVFQRNAMTPTSKPRRSTLRACGWRHSHRRQPLASLAHAHPPPAYAGAAWLQAQGWLAAMRMPTRSADAPHATYGNDTCQMQGWPGFAMVDCLPCVHWARGDAYVAAGLSRDSLHPMPIRQQRVRLSYETLLHEVMPRLA